jgi:hypothetical protein
MKLKDFLKQLNDAINSNPYITEMEIEYNISFPMISI